MATSPEPDDWPIDPGRIVVNRSTDFGTTDLPVNIMISSVAGRITLANIGGHPLGFEQLQHLLADVRAALRDTLAVDADTNIVLGWGDE